MNSDQVKKGFQRAPHRGLFMATGVKREDFPKPFTIPGLPRKLLWDQGEINRWFEKNRIPATHGEPVQLRAAHGRLQPQK